jgi:hypothetical protein
MVEVVQARHGDTRQPVRAASVAVGYEADPTGIPHVGRVVER